MRSAYLTPLFSLVLIILSIVYWNATVLMVPLVGLFVVQLSRLYFKSSCKDSKSYRALYSLFAIWLTIAIITPFIPIITSKPPETAPNFQLMSYDHKSFDLYYHKNSPFILLISGGDLTSPPPTILQTLNSRQDVISVIIDNKASTRTDLEHYSKTHLISERILVDPSNIIHYEYKLTHQWNAALISTDTWSIVYRGPLTTSGTRLNQTLTLLMSPPFKHVNRLTELPLTGQPIHVQENGPISYSKDVVPMLSKACLSCHNSRGIGTFSLDNYTTVLGWSAMIKEVLLTKRMPPFPADHYFGAYNTHPLLSNDERLEFIQWINQGSSHNGEEDPLIAYNKNASNQSIWSPLGTPDLIIDLPNYIVPKLGEDAIIDIPINLTISRDITVKALRFISNDYQSLGHVGFYIKNPNSNLNYHNITASKYIGGRAPGYFGDDFYYPDNHYLLLKKSDELRVNLHYTPYGKSITSRSKVGFYFSKAPTGKPWQYFMFYPKKIEIKPNESNYSTEISSPVDRTLMIYTCHIHFHNRGSQSQLIVVTPNQKRKILLSIPRYDPNWQMAYTFKDPIIIEKGSTIIAKGFWDNSSLNPNNPDSNQEVHEGDGTKSEMFVITLIGVEL